MGFSVYDLLKEAEGDEQEQAAAPADPNAADAPAENPDDAGADDDNFDIDANLDEPDDAGDDENVDEPAEGGDDFGDTGGGGSEEEDEEPVDANTDIFASLTAEEQQMKIMELKLQYNNLYNSCSDLLEKINNLTVDEDSIEFIRRMTGTLFDLKRYIADYLVYTFAEKSFIENDIMFNRFLSIIQSMTVAFDKFQKTTAKDVENEVKK